MKLYAAVLSKKKITVVYFETSVLYHISRKNEKMGYLVQYQKNQKFSSQVVNCRKSTLKCQPNSQVRFSVSSRFRLSLRQMLAKERSGQWFFFWGKFLFQGKSIFGIFGGTAFRGNFRFDFFGGNCFGENIVNAEILGEMNQGKCSQKYSPKITRKISPSRRVLHREVLFFYQQNSNCKVGEISRDLKPGEMTQGKFCFYMKIWGK